MKKIVFIRNVVDHWEGWDLKWNETYTDEWWWWYTTEFHALPRIWNNWTGALSLHNHTKWWPTEVNSVSLNAIRAKPLLWLKTVEKLLFIKIVVTAESVPFIISLSARISFHHHYEHVHLSSLYFGHSL